jgi:RNA polymerase sigma-70 factor (ECF subfamily)
MIEDADRLYEWLLVVRCQAGDETAFAELIARYQQRLRYYLQKMLFDVGDADDVLQEVWFDVFRAITRLAEPGAFRAWLYSIARGRAAKTFRKRRLVFQALDDGALDELADDQEAFAADEAEQVHAKLDLLPAAQREVLVLRYIEDMSYDEIAGIINCQVGTVRSRLHYGKRGLRELLERESRDER